MNSSLQCDDCLFRVVGMGGSDNDGFGTRGQHFVVVHMACALARLRDSFHEAGFVGVAQLHLEIDAFRK
jgi:hypothetical protein